MKTARVEGAGWAAEQKKQIPHLVRDDKARKAGEEKPARLQTKSAAPAAGGVKIQVQTTILGIPRP